MKLQIVLLINLIGVGCLHAMQKEVTFDEKTKIKIDRFILKNDLSELQRLLGPIPSKAHEYALEQAVIEHKLAIIDWLLDIGTNVNATYHTGNTPLHIAADYDNTALVSLLLKHEANINARNEDGKTPLERAIDRHNNNVVNLLQKAKREEEARFTVPATPRPGYKIITRKS